MIEIIGHEKKNIKIKVSKKLQSIYSEFSIDENSYIAVLNGNPATSDDIINPDDNLVLLEVFSGG